MLKNSMIFVGSQFFIYKKRNIISGISKLTIV